MLDTLKYFLRIFVRLFYRDSEGKNIFLDPWFTRETNNRTIEITSSIFVSVGVVVTTWTIRATSGNGRPFC